MPIVAAVPQLIDPVLLVLRLTVGAMYLLSGFFKLTDGARRQRMHKSLTEAGIPAPGAMTPVISAGELLGGAGVLLGLFTALSALVLLVISAGALVTTAIPKAEGQGVSRLENVLYTPEALLVAATALLIATGGGNWSLDRLLFP